MTELREKITLQLDFAMFNGKFDDVITFPMIMNCPDCSARHIDEGDFERKPHHTHACQECGRVWRPAKFNTHGVRFLPGYKNGDEPEHIDIETSTTIESLAEEEAGKKEESKLPPLAAQRLALMHWFNDEHSLELVYHSPIFGDDDDQRLEWRVQRWTGHYNDREWSVIGRGKGIWDAIEDAQLNMAVIPHKSQQEEIGSNRGLTKDELIKTYEDRLNADACIFAEYARQHREKLTSGALTPEQEKAAIAKAEANDAHIKEIEATLLLGKRK
jgi:hypothetical protein